MDGLLGGGEGFLLAVTDAGFFFRLQQQRAEDGVQKTRAVCKLQRAGLAGSASFLICCIQTRSILRILHTT